MSSKSIYKILLYTVTKFARFFETQCTITIFIKACRPRPMTVFL